MLYQARQMPVISLLLRHDPTSCKSSFLRKGQLLVKLGHYHAEPHEAEATPEANNVRTETPYPYLPPKVELVIILVGTDLGGEIRCLSPRMANATARTPRFR